MATLSTSKGAFEDFVNRFGLERTFRVINHSLAVYPELHPWLKLANAFGVKIRIGAIQAAEYPSPLSLHRFDVQLDTHIVPHHQTAGVQSGVPGHTKVPPVNRHCCLDSEMSCALKITLTIYFEGQRYLFCGSVHRECTDGHQARTALLHPGALKGDFGIFRDIKKVGRAQVLVSSCEVSIDALGFDSDFDRRPRDVLLVKEYYSHKVGETSSDVVDDKMSYGKPDMTMSRIDGVFVRCQ